jgi:hypothetical protein
MASKLLVILVICGMGFSYNAKYGGELFQDGKNDRNAALGGLSVSFADGCNAVLLQNNNTPYFHFSHKNKFGGLGRVTIFSYLHKGKKYPLYFGLTNRSIDNIPNTSSACNPSTLDCNYSEVNYFSQKEIGIQLSTIRFWGPYTLGFNLKPSFTSLDQSRGYGLSGDVGILFNPFANMDVTLRFEDILGIKYWDTGTMETIFPLFIGGMQYRFTRLRVGLETGSRIESNSIVQYHIGFEYKQQEQLYFRLGTSNSNQFTAGLGIHLSLIDFSYAYLHPDVGSPFEESHIISVGMKLDEFDRIKDKIAP